MAETPKTKSYSLWVSPRGVLADKLTAEIVWLATAVAGAPTFPPHVTLLGGIESSDERDVLARAQRLAQSLKPYRISFDRAAHGHIYFQCVYLLCITEPGTMRAGAATRAAFGQDPGSRYMPHLSLLYSDIGEEDRRRIAADEQQRLLGPGPDVLLQEDERGFEVQSLTVWETEEGDKALATWRQLAEYPLGGS